MTGSPPPALLRAEAVRAGYGNVEVLHELTVALHDGSLCAIVGANGAGKTTLLMTLAGALPLRAGHVWFDGNDVSRLRPHERVQRGLVLVPEGRRMLAGMSVEENLLVAAAAARGDASARIAELFERFPILRERRSVAAGSLSGGEQQMLAIARALAIGPRALLLDEPSMGLAPKLVDAIFEIIADERRRGTAILLIEQNARRALAIADRAYVMDRGRVVLEGSGAELASDRDVVAAYLGG
jgi:branched-chain amino acid transport system ATP-binding protein